MKFSPLLLFATMAIAAPASEDIGVASRSPLELPRGWAEIDPAEVARRMTPMSDARGIAKRKAGAVYLCTKPDWKGRCAVIDFGIAYKCHAIPEPFKNNLGSAGPDKGAICRVTTTESADTCGRHGNLFLEYPGFKDLFCHDGQDYGSQAHHITCQECTACQGNDSD